MSAAAPDGRRSIAGQVLSGLPVDGQLHLQRCADCGATQYPPRERCHACLGDALPVVVVACGATVVATTTLHHSLEPWFAERLPWTVVSLQLDAGPIALAHALPELASAGARVRVATARDAAGAWCLVAFAADGEARSLFGETLQKLGFDA